MRTKLISVELPPNFSLLIVSWSLTRLSGELVIQIEPHHTEHFFHSVTWSTPRFAPEMQLLSFVCGHWSLLVTVPSFETFV